MIFAFGRFFWEVQGTWYVLLTGLITLHIFGGNLRKSSYREIISRAISPDISTYFHEPPSISTY